jgi:hypothetical protein
MAFSQNDKLKFLDALTDALRQGQLAEINLRSQGRVADADAIRKSTAPLSAKVDALVGTMMAEWLGQVDKSIADIAACTEGLQGAVEQIKKKVAIAQNVVKGHRLRRPGGGDRSEGTRVRRTVATADAAVEMAAIGLRSDGTGSSRRSHVQIQGGCHGRDRTARRSAAR